MTNSDVTYSRHTTSSFTDCRLSNGMSSESAFSSTSGLNGTISGLLATSGGSATNGPMCNSSMGFRCLSEMGREEVNGGCGSNSASNSAVNGLLSMPSLRDNDSCHSNQHPHHVIDDDRHNHLHNNLQRGNGSSMSACLDLLQGHPATSAGAFPSRYAGQQSACLDNNATTSGYQLPVGGEKLFSASPLCTPSHHHQGLRLSSCLGGGGVAGVGGGAGVNSPQLSPPAHLSPPLDSSPHRSPSQLTAPRTSMIGSYGLSSGQTLAQSLSYHNQLSPCTANPMNGDAITPSSPLDYSCVHPSMINTSTSAGIHTSPLTYPSSDEGIASPPVETLSPCLQLDGGYSLGCLTNCEHALGGANNSSTPATTPATTHATAAACVSGSALINSGLVCKNVFCHNCDLNEQPDKQSLLIS